jgi:hypothetical protein
LTGQGPPPAAGTPVFVDVTAQDSGDGVLFSHEWRWGEGGPSQGNGAIAVPKRLASDPGTQMHFALNDKSSRNLRFSEQQGSAMWVQRDSCPPQDVRCDDPEIPADQMSVAPKLLKVFNVNSEQCDLHYCLWFQDKNGISHAYDPEIQNGGKV